ncbi:cytochrome c oxidase accessory protein CcoG [Paracoccus seriniphilus]|uniref:Cytochrome c oxidase accessory protein FixG n=1 Tax=Paracoccus seriniphilus TaxID=184748 RepID=A0A239PN01_9RHOB|nr:cytochrome c oxidase accessory protein CcoG [Paracoccus seriniphilus]WCR14895.1 cytochrome c oxidase accessory protein CcoG [Paracoccus seriniphilus]SNT71685.1 cytochrome c oxidase accessory protein FixG [Paracoccus seriniphilus]
MSTDQTNPPGLYAAREPIFPKRVKGRFRNLKWIVMALTLAVYYIMPWIRWDRGPNMPDQAVLVDLANRRFFFFWIEIWPHEFYFVAGLLVMAGLGLFLFTSALGRVWCGYTCPQTVWTDLFILVERWIEGDRNNRIRLHRQNWNARKVRLRLVKWTVWLIIALLTGGAWIFYFTDAPTLLRDLVTGQAHPVAYITMAVLTATTFLFGGFAREQICIYACPWPRIQAAMMDEDTLTVAYREWRGEPRGKKAPAKQAAGSAASAPDLGGSGDCIDCLACVNVCPMGIDIRDGQQLECITCALCIDACDDIMDKIGKPRGLIDYMALKDETAERAGEKPRPVLKHILRPRTILYFTLWSGIGILLLVALLMRSSVDMNVSPVRNPLYVTMSDGAIRNTYELRLRNKQHEAREYAFTVEGAEGVEMKIEGAEGNSVTVPADETLSARLYLTAPAGSPLTRSESDEIRLVASDLQGDATATVETVFHGKGE